MKGSLSKNSAAFRHILNRIFIAFSGGSHRKPILDPSTIYPELDVFIERYDEIKAEVDGIVNSRSCVEYSKIDPIRSKEVSSDWSLYYIMLLRELNENATQMAPIISELCWKNKNVIAATVALLKPGVSLAPHEGPYAGILRYHLGITIPKVAPPYIRVLDEEYTWCEREAIMIDDVYMHEVVNESPEARVILMIDVLRPMPFLLDRLNRFCISLKKRWGATFIRRTKEALQNV